LDWSGFGEDWCWDSIWKGLSFGGSRPRLLRACTLATLYELTHAWREYVGEKGVDDGDAREGGAEREPKPRFLPCLGAAVSRDFWKLGKAVQFSSPAYLGTAFWCFTTSLIHDMALNYTSGHLLTLQLDSV
jgi:hypothetical protein